jgi:hypothetical protein
VILDLGQIITHEAIQAAYDAGALDPLLSAAYRGEFVFAKEEVRVGQPGSASVERATGAAPIIDELGQQVERAQQKRARSGERQRIEADAERVRREAERAMRAEQRDRRRVERSMEREAAASEVSTT